MDEVLDFYWNNWTKEERKEKLKLSIDKKIKITNDIISDVLSAAKKPIVQFSGGADSCLMGWFIHNIDKNIPFVFNNWGLSLPKTIEFIKKYFETYNIKHFITESGYDYNSFIKEYGFPIFKGLKSIINKQEYKKYNITDKCRKLRNICWKQIIENYSPDYFFVGIVAQESVQREVIFVKYGFLMPKTHNTVLVKPIALFTKQEVFQLLKKNNILWEKESYEYEYNGTLIKWHENPQKTMGQEGSDLECFMCPVRFKSEGWGRLGRLARNNNDKFNELMDMGLRDIFYKIVKDYPDKTDYISDFLETYDPKYKSDKPKLFT